MTRELAMKTRPWHSSVVFGGGAKVSVLSADDFLADRPNLCRKFEPIPFEDSARVTLGMLGTVRLNVNPWAIRGRFTKI